MSFVRIDANPSRRQLAVFGVTWLVFLAVVGVIVLSRGGSTAVATSLWGAALVVPAIGWLVPAFMRIVYLGMAYLTFPIGFVVSYVVVSAIYYSVLVPTGMLMRLFGYDPMTRRFDGRAESYWVPRKTDGTPARYFRQF